MLNLALTTDKLQLITSAAQSTDVHVSYADYGTGNTVAPDKKNTNIATATTTDIVAVPGASTVRNVRTIVIRNKGSANNDVTVVFNQNGTLFELYKRTLAPGDGLFYTEASGFSYAPASVFALTNRSVAAQGPGFAADTYLVGSAITIPTGLPILGTTYRLWFDVVKTAAGTATPIITVRIGAAGSTADTARTVLTFGAGTAAADTGVFEALATFRSVGAGTSAVVEGSSGVNCGTGIVGSTNAKGAQNTGAGFDSSAIAGQIIGASFNAGASFSGTVQLVRAELIPA